jgi:hypothetical protein
MGNRRANRAPIPSISALVENELWGNVSGRRFHTTEF